MRSAKSPPEDQEEASKWRHMKECTRYTKAQFSFWHLLTKGNSGPRLSNILEVFLRSQKSWILCEISPFYTSSVKCKKKKKKHYMKKHIYTHTTTHTHTPAGQTQSIGCQLMTSILTPGATIYLLILTTSQCPISLLRLPWESGSIQKSSKSR